MDRLMRQNSSANKKTAEGEKYRKSRSAAAIFERRLVVICFCLDRKPNTDHHYPDRNTRMS